MTKTGLAKSGRLVVGELPETDDAVSSGGDEGHGKRGCCLTLAWGSKKFNRATTISHTTIPPSTLAAGYHIKPTKFSHHSTLPFFSFPLHSLQDPLL